MGSTPSDIVIYTIYVTKILPSDRSWFQKTQRRAKPITLRFPTASDEISFTDTQRKTTRVNLKFLRHES